MFNNSYFFLAQRCINLSNQFLKPFLNKIIYQSALGLHKDAETNRNTENDPDRNDQGWKQKSLAEVTRYRLSQTMHTDKVTCLCFVFPMFLMSRETPCLKKKKKEANQIKLSVNKIHFIIYLLRLNVRHTKYLKQIVNKKQNMYE